ALMPFVPAGYPDLETTAACVLSLQDAGASLIEIGFPFSDPIADGPTIQEAFTYSLERGVRIAQIIETIKSIRDRLNIPLVAMRSYSIGYRYGLERFVRDLRDAGFAGLILPDLPPPEAQKVCTTIRSGGLDTILLVAPTTSPERRIEIATLCSGFVYYLSVSGITGERDQLPADLAANVRELKSKTNVPVCIGFGIHRAQQVEQLRGLADGAIVGTAFVRRMKEKLGQGPEQIAETVAEYCRKLNKS
ncbi:MAG: tryptophan synthase subunit alpha, partial [Anaerolineae bacterium]|nr:tryptophan synthase subunit alpha [Phycisphaerae bacterium]